MKRVAFLCLFFPTLVVGSYTQAQTCSNYVSGYVHDHSGDPLPGAVASLVGMEHQGITDKSGFFEFKDICPGEVLLRITFVGYEPHQQAVELPMQEPVKVVLVLAENVLEDVVVEAASAVKSATQTVSYLEDHELHALHGKPLGESLKEIPGVNAIQTGPAIFKPVIHGLHSQRILILNNGIRQEGQQWGVEHAPEIDPYIASQIMVLKGAETVRYGSAAMGGVIIINPPPLHKTKAIGGEFNLGLMSNNRMAVFSGLVEGPLSQGSPWSWRLQSSVKRGGDYHTPEYNLSNTAVRELNFSGAIGFEKPGRGMELYLSSFNTGIGILRASHTGNLADLQGSIENGRPWYIRDFSYEIAAPRQEISHHLLKLSAYQEVKELGKITVLYGGQYDQRNEFDIRRGGRNVRPSAALNLVSHVLDASLDHDHKAHSGSVGVNGTYKVNTNNTEYTGVKPLLPDYRHFSAGVFVLEKWKREKLVLEAGGRYDYQHLTVLTFTENQQLIKPQFNFNFLSGTVGATLLFSPRFRILSNFGISSRPPHVSELYSEGLHHGTASIEEGLMRIGGVVHTEPSLIKKEYSRKWVNTAQYTDEKLSVDISVYYNDIDNYVYIRPTGTRLTVRGYFPVFRYEQTDAVLLGSDAALKWELDDRLVFSSKLSYIYARDSKHDDVLIFIPPAQFENGLTYSVKELGVLQDVRVGVSVPITFRQTRAPRVVAPADINADNVPETIFDFAAAPEGYTLLNASIGFDIPVGEHFLSVSLTGENLLNTSYRNYMNRLRYYADDIGSNFILRLSYNFLPH